VARRCCDAEINRHLLVRSFARGWRSSKDKSACNDGVCRRHCCCCCCSGQARAMVDQRPPLPDVVMKFVAFFTKTCNQNQHLSPSLLPTTTTTLLRKHTSNPSHPLRLYPHALEPQLRQPLARSRALHHPLGRHEMDRPATLA